MVRAQKRLIDHLGIDRLFAVIGGSMGGMQVLEWAATYPNSVFAAVPIATARLSLGAEHRLPRGRAAGDLRRSRLARRPLLGARAAAGARPGGGAHGRAHHLSVRAGADAQVRPPRCAARRRPALFDDMFEVESYLRHQGSSFVRRFDAASYLTITRAMDYFDLAADHDGDLSAAVPRHAHAVLRRQLHQRLAVPDRGEPRDRARAEPRRGQCQLRRDRVRQGARRLPARRAGLPPHAGRASSPAAPSMRGCRHERRRSIRCAMSPRTCGSTCA